MSLYSKIRPLLFLCDPERAHNLAFIVLKIIDFFGFTGKSFKESCSVSLMGLKFPNRLGLAAGFDKNGDCISALCGFGFGFIEIGTLTPRPQSGNPKPRLFRLVKNSAVINRMGFNNKGISYAVDRLKARQLGNIIGVNIGKNFDTSIEKASDDYLICLNEVYNYASYIVINVSSPNTKNLRSLQSDDALKELLFKITEERKSLREIHKKHIAILLKVAPDLTVDEIRSIARIVDEYDLDGVVATNTTISRENLKDEDGVQEVGGLSGRPLKAKSLEVVREFREVLPKGKVIIGVGGVFNKEDYQDMLDAGADLVQIYTSLVYKGPGVVREIVR